MKTLSKKQIHILSIAEELIASKGFKNTSIREICSKAEVNIALISYYFGSKEKMLGYLFRYRVLKTKENFIVLCDMLKNSKPEIQLKEIVKNNVMQLFSFHYFNEYLLEEIGEDNVIKAEIQHFYKVVEKKLQEIILKGNKTGVFTFSPDPEDVLATLIGTTQFVVKNSDFYSFYLKNTKDNTLIESEKKIKAHLLLTIFAIVGYSN